LTGEDDRLRREVERLRAENAGLSRLLQLGGRDTTPPSEQLAVPSPGPVTMRSPEEDKLALFIDRFRARTDCHAIRWENRWTGKGGWIPAVAGGWRKSMDRRLVKDLPLTPRVVEDHLKGNVFIGLYPLLRDNTCHFLAADSTGRRRCSTRWPT
jgi:hypothetical protein